jgi:hypothetical protein
MGLQVCRCAGVGLGLRVGKRGHEQVGLRMYRHGTADVQVCTCVGEPNWFDPKLLRTASSRNQLGGMGLRVVQVCHGPAGVRTWACWHAGVTMSLWVGLRMCGRGLRVYRCGHGPAGLRVCGFAGLRVCGLAGVGMCLRVWRCGAHGPVCVQMVWAFACGCGGVVRMGLWACRCGHGRAGGPVNVQQACGCAGGRLGLRVCRCAHR